MSEMLPVAKAEELRTDRNFLQEKKLSAAKNFSTNFGGGDDLNAMQKMR